MSRSDKKILHVDKNGYYGGPDAALSLQEAEEWCTLLKDGASGMILPAPTCRHSLIIKSGGHLPFSNASIATPATEKDSSDIGGTTKLSFSRAYSLALSPQLIYCLSVLIPTLVSAKVDLQLEFLAFGNWWIYKDHNQDLDETAAGQDYPRGALVRVPNGREDVFADQNIDMRSKRGLTRFLRFITDFEDQPEVWQEHKLRPFTAFLTSQFGLPLSVQQSLLALTLSPSRPSEVTTSFALPRVAKHLRSIGLFGPGFGAVIPKWGGLADVAQIGCRAGAVGGGVYVLDNGIEKIFDINNADRKTQLQNKSLDRATKVTLKKGEVVSTDWIIGAQDNIPWTETTLEAQPTEITSVEIVSRSISIVSSKLAPLFSSTAEGSATSAGAMVVFPRPSTTVANSEQELPPIHIIAHSSATGECPEGQCKFAILIFAVMYLAVLLYRMMNHKRILYLHCLQLHC